MYDSFYVKNVSFLAGSKNYFLEEFHREVRHQNTIHKEMEKLKSKTEQLENAKDPSTAGYLLRESHTLKPHHSSIIKRNLNQMDQIEKSVQDIEQIMKEDLQTAILESGKIQPGRKISQKFDEEVMFDLLQLRAKLATTKSILRNEKIKFFVVVVVLM